MGYRYILHIIIAGTTEYKMYFFSVNCYRHYQVFSCGNHAEQSIMILKDMDLQEMC